MGSKDQARRLAPYAQELVENAYVQENLRSSVDKLRGAYRRAQKRRVDPARDEKLRRQLRSATASLTEAARALRSGRRKPERRWGPRVAVIIGLSVAGAVAAVWAKQRLDNESSDSAESVSAAVEDGAEATPQPAVA